MTEVLDGRRKGGLARAAVLAPDERRRIAQEAARARWAEVGEVRRATHEGPLNLGGIEIACAVLDDGSRVLSSASFARAMGRRGNVKVGALTSPDSDLPVFLQAENLKQFLPADFVSSAKPVIFRTKNGPLAHGYRAELLNQVCHIFIDAKLRGALRPSQEHIFARCQILSKAFSTVGLTALIDEATGYQEVRDRQALQAILDRYLAKELAAWAKRFPDEFYKEMFRLRDWKWNPANRKMSHAVAKYTNDIVYARLAPNLLEELQARNPSENGSRKAKHHMWLTEDVGHPALAQHLHTVCALMRISASWNQFREILDKALPKKTSLADLPLFAPVAEAAKP